MLRHRDFRMEKKQLVVLSSVFFHGINKRTTCDMSLFQVRLGF